MKILFLIIITFTVIILTNVDDSYELNPYIRSDNDICGIWTYESELLIINSDKTFIFRKGTNKFFGEWTLEDWNLRLKGNLDSYLRVISLGSKYYLLKNTENKSIEEWDFSQIYKEK
jgi:hypothetical protein